MMGRMGPRGCPCQDDEEGDGAAPRGAPGRWAQGAGPAGPGGPPWGGPPGRRGRRPRRSREWPEGTGEVEGEGGEAEARREAVLAVRVTPDALLAVDVLVHAGLARSRSEAAALLIDAGVRSNRALFAKIESLKEELTQLRALAQGLQAEGTPGQGGGGEPAGSADATPSQA
jgi:hypothetical protein